MNQNTGFDCGVGKRFRIDLRKTGFSGHDVNEVENVKKRRKQWNRMKGESYPALEAQLQGGYQK
jgi:hypothetical protein